MKAVGAENYGALAYIMESPHEKGVIWTGSDDGMVYVTRDNGVSWQNVTPAGLKECLINAIEVSPHDKATAYIPHAISLMITHRAYIKPPTMVRPGRISQQVYLKAPIHQGSAGR